MHFNDWFRHNNLKGHRNKNHDLVLVDFETKGTWSFGRIILDILKPAQTVSDKTIPFLESIAETAMLASVRKGLALVLPLIIVGAVALLILHLPLPQLHAFLTSLCGGHCWQQLCLLVQQGSFSIAALAALICRAHSHFPGFQKSLSFDAIKMICFIPIIDR